LDFILFIQSYSNPLLDNFFELVTMMGEDLFIMIVVGIIFWSINKQFGYRMAFVYLSSAVLNQTLKEVFKIQRIIGEKGIRSLRLETAGGYSFPSGHTQSAASFWTVVMLKIKKKWFYGVAVLMMVLVAFSRLYLGVHRPVDVIFGLIIGFSWVFLASFIFDQMVKNDRRVVPVICFLILIAMVFVRNYTFYKAAGTTISLLLGYMIESRYIKYTVKAPIIQQIFKLLIGFSGLLIIKSGVKVILPAVIFSDFLRYFILGLWLTVGAPSLFKRFIYSTIESDNEITPPL